MAKYFMTPYTVRVLNKKDKSFLMIGGFGEGNDILKILKDYLDLISNSFCEDESCKKRFRASNVTNNGRSLSGIIKSGEYGYASDIVNKEGDVAYKKKMTDAETIPFFFMFHLPNDSDEGILIVQSIEQKGIKGIFTRGICKYFEPKYSGFSLQFNTLVPQKMLERIITEGKTRKISLIRFTIPSDVADSLDMPHTEEKVTLKYSIEVGKNSSIPFLSKAREFINGERDLDKLIEIHDFEYDTIKIEVDALGRKRTIDLGNIHRLRSSYDVTQDLSIGSDGYPDLASLVKVSGEILDELLNLLWGPKT